MSLKENVVDFGILLNVERLAVPRIIDQFGRKRCQKKRKDVDYKLFKIFFKNILVYMSSRLLKIRSVHSRMVYFG